MRRFLVVVLACLGFPLVAAAAPPTYSTKPMVVVFPFTANGSQIDREASSRLATIIATQMANTGNVRVVPPPPGTERKDFLSVARANDCDYYISGFISSLGDGVSVVEQVVSTATGIVVFSNTAQLKTYADAAGQGDDLASFIVRHANRAYSSIGTPPPAASPTPQPAGEAQTNLGKLFGRKKKPTAAAPAKPSPAPAASAPAAALVNATPTPAVVAAVGATPATNSFAVVPVGGGASQALREIAAARTAERARGERAVSAAVACGAHPQDVVLSGTLSLRADPASGGMGATYDLSATNCAGKTLWHGSYSNDAGGPQAGELATQRAVDAAVDAYLNPPKHRRRGG